MAQVQPFKITDEQKGRIRDKAVELQQRGATDEQIRQFLTGTRDRFVQQNQEQIIEQPIQIQEQIVEQPIVQQSEVQKKAKPIELSSFGLLGTLFTANREDVSRAVGKAVIPFGDEELFQKVLNMFPDEPQDEQTRKVFLDDKFRSNQFLNKLPTSTKGAIYGTIQSMWQFGLGLTSPANLALIAGTGVVSGVAQKIITGLFATEFIKHLPEESSQLIDAIKGGSSTKIAKELVDVGLNALLATTLTKSTLSGITPKIRSRIKEIGEKRKTLRIPIEEIGKRVEVPIKREVIKQVQRPKRAVSGALVKTQKAIKPVVTQKAFDAITSVEKKQVKTDLPDYAGSINLKKQNISLAEKQFEVETSKIVPKRVQTWDKTGELSKELRSDYNKAARVLRKAKTKGTALNTVEIDAIRQINVNAINRLKEIAETAPKEKFVEQFSSYVNDIFKPLSNASSEAGRALNIHKKEISTRRVSKAFEELKRGLNERELKEFKELNLENPIQVKEFVDRLGDPKFQDYFFEFWYNSILSGIPTHLVNVTSNTAWGLYNIPHRGLSGLIDASISKLTGRKRQIYISEMIPMFGGQLSGFTKGKARVKELLRTGKIQTFEDKWNIDISTKSVSAWERSPYKPMRQLAPYMSAPTRALRAMDVWANSMAFDAQINALARRKGLQRGLKGEELKTFEKKLAENPTDSMVLDATEFAKHNTFMDNPGKLTTWLIEGRGGKIGEVLAPVSRIVVPFMNTIANLTKRGLELTPGIGLALPSLRTRPVPEIVAKQIEGSILTLYILSKADKGEITGAVPTSKTEREAFYRQGKQSWAIKIGDTWYSYRRAEPWATVIASAAIAHDRITKSDDEDTNTEIFMDTANGMIDFVLDSSYLSGLTSVLDRFGQREGFIQRTFASFVPYSSFWRSMNRAYEVATTGKTKVRDTKSFLGAFTQVIPGLSDKSPAKLNVWGEEISLPGNVFRQWLPYKWSQELDDIVEKEFLELEIYPGLPGKNVTIKGEKIEFPDEFYRNYAITFGKVAKEKMKQIISGHGREGRIYKSKKTVEERSKYLDSELNKIRRKELDNAKKRFIQTR